MKSYMCKSDILYIRRWLEANIRVGEAFTKDRKSSAASRDGLVDMVRRAHDREESKVEMQVCAGLGCRSLARTMEVLSMG
jgi:hypothetical protein